MFFGGASETMVAAEHARFGFFDVSCGGVDKGYWSVGEEEVAGRRVDDESNNHG